MSNYTISNNWKWVRCYDVIDVRDGTHDTPKYTVSGIPLITSKNLKTNGIDFENIQYISLEDHEQISKRSKVDNNDILYSMIGTIGNPVIVETDREFSIKNVALFKTSNNTKVDPSFFRYLLLSNIVTNQLKNESRGGIQEFVSLNVLRKLQIPLPPLPEQKHIAAILDKADAVRRKRQETIRLLDEFLRSVFLEMFGDPVRNEKGWEVASLKSISDKFNDGPFGSNLKTEHYTNDGVRVIRLQNIGIAQFINDDKAYISEDYYLKTLKKYSCEPGDVIIGTLGNPNLRACILPDFLKVAINKADCIYCRPNKKIALPEYICYLLNLPQTLSLVSNMVHGQTRGRISMGQLSNLIIPVPPILEQKKFLLITNKIKIFRNNLEKSLNLIENNFNSIMQRTFFEKL